MARVLVTDADSRAALASVRSLGRSGHQVFTAGSHAPSLAAASRFSSGFYRYADPMRQPAEFVRDIVDHTTRHRIDVLLPMTEVTTLLATFHRHLLPATCHLPFPLNKDVARASDKAVVTELARSLGIPLPVTLIAMGPQDAAAIAAQATYPAVIKPARSRVASDTGWISTGVTYAADAAELVSRLAAFDQRVFPILVQERIVGPGAGVFACCDRGRPIAHFAHRRLREKPPSGGVSVLCESIAPDPIAARQALQLLAALEWHGVAMVEFKQDNRDGSLKLMEINGRFWGSLQLAIDAGVDFPSLAVDLALGNPVEPIDSYRTGVRSRWFLGDLDALLSVLLHSRTRLNLPPNHPGRLRTLWDFMHLWSRGQYYEVERWSDPRPGMLEARRWLIGG